MSEASERQRARVEEDTFASWAKPRLEERVNERRWRPTKKYLGFGENCALAARRRATEGGRQTGTTQSGHCPEAAE